MDHNNNVYINSGHTLVLCLSEFLNELLTLRHDVSIGVSGNGHDGGKQRQPHCDREAC